MQAVDRVKYPAARVPAWYEFMSWWYRFVPSSTADRYARRTVQPGATKPRTAFELVHAGDLECPDGARLHVAGEVVTLGRSNAADVQINDDQVSALHCEIAGTPEGVVLRDLSSTNGTFVGNVKVRECVLTGATKIRIGRSELLFEPAERREPDLSPKANAFGSLVGGTAAMRKLFQTLHTVASTDLSVLVTGETGTGKELVARGLHVESKRASGPFVVVDCAALPVTLAESLLFGHDKGAFTGADQRADGSFHRAHGGTIFLDELGELPLELQPKLLRAIAERSVQRVGGSSYDDVDVRVVAATRRDLRREMNERRFREDLFFRIAQVRLELPPLRTRLADMPALVAEACRRAGRTDDSERVNAFIQQRFANYDWPGNVRELVNVASVLTALGEGAGADLLPVEGAAPTGPGEQRSATQASTSHPLGFVDAKREFEHAYFERLLDATDNNLSEVARRCGLARHNVRAHLRKLGLWK